MTAVGMEGAKGELRGRIAGQRRIDIPGLLISGFTFVFAIIWAFPMYWAMVTTFKPESDVVRAGLRLWPEHFTLDAYWQVLTHTKIIQWYMNSLFTSIAVTVIVIVMSAACGYALSQLKFPGRGILWGIILAGFMVPIQALIVNHFVLMNQFGFINTWQGIILPQLIIPVVVIVYKQFFDSVPKEFREAALMDNANEFQLLFKVFLPMNWGVTTALAIITFIAAWNNFLWPFLVSTSEDKMVVTVGITQVHDAFGVQYARELAAAVLAGLPVALAYLIFQKRVTQAIMLSSGIKG